MEKSGSGHKETLKNFRFSAPFYPEKLSAKAAFRKTSLVDYPGLVSAVIFFSGCNLRCPWCHNRELVLTEVERTADTAGSVKNELSDFQKPELFDLEEILNHIEKRRGVLGAVVLSGGEPTLFPYLEQTIARVKQLGLKVKLDTNGTRPDALENLFKDKESRPDYIAMDLKTAPERYALLAPVRPGAPPTEVPAGTAVRYGEAVKQSAAIIRASGIAHEFRSLSLPSPWFDEAVRAALTPLAGDSTWLERPFVPGNCLDPAWDTCPGGPLRGSIKT